MGKKNRSQKLVAVPARVEQPEDTPTGGVFGDLQRQFQNHLQVEAEDMANTMSEIVAVVRGRNHYLRTKVLEAAKQQLEDAKEFAHAQGLDE